MTVTALIVAAGSGSRMGGELPKQYRLLAGKSVLAALAVALASFMAGVAANVSAFNTVVTTDLVEPYIKPGQSDDWYVRFGRVATIGGSGG